MANILDSIKSLFGGKVEVKVSELLEKIIAAVKPIIEKGEASEALAGAVSNFGDLGQKLKDILAKIKSASGDALSGLNTEKDGIVASIVEKGTALLDSIEASENLPEGVKELAQKAEALLKKLK